MTPNQAGQEENKELIVKLNREKQAGNHRVSNLKPGDTVRVLQTNIFKKGPEAKWSEDTYKVVKEQGETITIDEDGNERYKPHKLLKVPNN